jgi:hypothetical protein
MSFWPAPFGAELMVNGLPTGTALSYNNPKQSIDEDFATFRTIIADASGPFRPATPSMTAMASFLLGSSL